MLKEGRKQAGAQAAAAAAAAAAEAKRAWFRAQCQLKEAQQCRHAVRKTDAVAAAGNGFCNQPGNRKAAHNVGRSAEENHHAAVVDAANYAAPSAPMPQCRRRRIRLLQRQPTSWIAVAQRAARGWARG